MEHPRRNAWPSFFKISLASVFLLAGTLSRAALITYSDEFPATNPRTYQSTPWEKTFSLPQFDPRLGSLEGVTILLETAISVTQGYENLSHKQKSINLTDRATVSLSLGDQDPLLTTHLQVSRNYSAPGYDGTLDFAGRSGATITGLTAEETRSITFKNHPGRSPFVGPGNLDFDLEAGANNFFSDHDGNFAAFGLASAWADVSVIYQFIPVPETSTVWMAVAASGLLVACLFRGQRQLFK